jgi:hypothetical protein
MTKRTHWSLQRGRAAEWRNEPNRRRRTEPKGRRNEPTGAFSGAVQQMTKRTHWRVHRRRAAKWRNEANSRRAGAHDGADEARPMGPNLHEQQSPAATIHHGFRVRDAVTRKSLKRMRRCRGDGRERPRGRGGNSRDRGSGAGDPALSGSSCYEKVDPSAAKAGLADARVWAVPAGSSTSAIGE